MFCINNYIKVSTAKEAVDLIKNKKAVILGGMHWLKMQKKTIPVAVDISNLGLDKITENADSFEIGSAVTLREIETHKGLNDYTNDAIKKTVENIVGIQFRNTASVGGSIVNKSGFSDIITTLLVLDATLCFYEAGKIRLCDYMKRKKTKDLLISVKIKKKFKKVSYQSFRNNATDFSVVNAALAVTDDFIRFTVGARPQVAKLVVKSIKEFNEASDIKKFARQIAGEYDYASNMRGSKEYRKYLAGVLISRGLEEIKI